VAAALTVKRARVTRAVASRGEVESWLARVATDRLGLAGDEILYVPRLRLRVPAQAGSVNGRIPDLILEALRAELSTAERGWDSGFSPGRAYRFTSHGRYFAWLIALWVRDGSIAARAAFAAATGEESLRQWQRVAVLADGATLVATIARLAEIGCAARWIALFEPADIALAHRALEHRFAVRIGQAAQPPGFRADFETAVDPVMASPPPAPLQEAVARLIASGNDWHALPPLGRALLLGAAVLARSPAQSMAQAAAFAAAIARVTDPVAARSVDSAPAFPLRAALHGVPTHQREPVPAGSARPMPGVPHADRRRATSPARSGQSAFPVERRATPTDRTRAAIESPASSVARAPDSAGGAVPGLPVAAPLSLSPAAPGKGEPVPFLAPDAHFETGFGGLLFLLNAFVALDLYPDFTQPGGARLEPSPLWLADRIGRYWFGARYRGDGLAGWIAAQAAAGRLPAVWRAKSDWLIGFETRAAPRLTVRRGRTTLWHPAGFPLRDGKEGRVHRRSCAVGFRHPIAARISPAGSLPSNPADRWAACLALYLNARLRLLCGAGLSLLALPARVRTRDLDLAATFALDRHPIQLRLAGLDRNPGWQPAEGRSFAFVFE